MDLATIKTVKSLQDNLTLKFSDVPVVVISKENIGGHRVSILSINASWITVAPISIDSDDWRTYNVRAKDLIPKHHAESLGWTIY